MTEKYDFVEEFKKQCAEDVRIARQEALEEAQREVQREVQREKNAHIANLIKFGIAKTPEEALAILEPQAN